MKNYFQKKCLFAFLFLGIFFGVSEMRAAETDYPSSAAAQTYSVTFSVNGVETIVTQSAAGAAVIPVEVTPLNGYVLAGWSETPINVFETSSKQTIVKLTDGKYVPEKNVTLYAVFARNGKYTDEGELLIYANVNGTRYYMATTPQKISSTSFAVAPTKNRNSAMPFTVECCNLNRYSISYVADDGNRWYFAGTATRNMDARMKEYLHFRENGSNGLCRFLTEDNNYALNFSRSDNYFKYYVESYASQYSDYYFDLNLESVLYTTKFTYDLTVSEAGYATLCLPFNATKPNGLQVFTARYDEGKVTLEECPSRVIRAGEGYIVKAVPGEYTFVATNEEVAASAENSLVGVTETEKLKDDGKIYIFAQQEGVIGFYRLEGNGSLEKNKAYLKISEPLSSRDAIHLN